MADDKKENEKPQADDAAAKPKGKKPLFLGGGMFALIAAAYVVSLVAFPGAEPAPPFGGPYLTDLSTDDIQVNLRGDGGRRYLVMSLRAEYEGYDELYVTTRITDPVYQAKLQDELIGLARKRSREDVEDDVGLETLMIEIQDAVDPLIFPVHVGNALSETEAHEKSGLRPGRSVKQSTMRGGFKAHVLHVDATEGTISLDDGPTVEFEGSEDDLLVESEHGLTVYVDVTGLDGEFVGEVHVGTFGRVLSILKGRFLIQ